MHLGQKEELKEGVIQRTRHKLKKPSKQISFSCKVYKITHIEKDRSKV